MKLGSVIFVMIVLVFSTGFLFSTNIQVGTEIQGLRDAQADGENQIRELEAEILTLQTQIRNLADALAQEQAANTEVQAQNQELLTQNETLILERDNALAQLAQTQQALKRFQDICAQTSPFAAGLAALTGQADLRTLAETASIPGLLVLILGLTTASGGGWYWWRHFRRPTCSPAPRPQPGEVWVRMTRPQARQFARSQRPIRNEKS